MNILTFDIEEWYIYQIHAKGSKKYYLPIINSYLDSLLDLLDHYEIKATFFCLGMVAKEHPEIIKKIASKKHEIGCHSFYHKWVNQMNNKEFKQDTTDAIAILEDLTGEKVRGYRAPAFSIDKKNKWAIDVLLDAGIEYDCSIFPSLRSYGGFPSFKEKSPSLIKHNGCCLKEFPIGMKTIGNINIAYSGGGYFRFLPYKLIKRFTTNSDYVMAYFHIRDFDARQKKIISPRYFLNYYGIKNAYSKFEHYICDFNYISVSEANDNIQWSNVPIIDL